MKRHLPAVILGAAAAGLAFAAVMLTLSFGAESTKAPKSTKVTKATGDCVILQTTGKSVCTTEPIVGQAARTLLACTKSTKAETCVTQLYSAAISQCGKAAECTSDAEKLTALVLARATGKPYRTFLG